MAVTIKDLYKQKSEVDEMSFECAEAHKRLRIIRGYYATFLYARELLNTDDSLEWHSCHPKSKNPEKDRYSSHQKVSMSLVHSKNRVLHEVGQTLLLYHDLRKKSDYDLHLDITPDDVTNAKDYFEFCKERIDFYIKNGDQHFTKSKKIVEVKVGSDGVKTSSLKLLK